MKIRNPRKACPLLTPRYPRSGGTSLSGQRNDSGQSMVEFGISLLFLLMILSVMIELGYAFYTLISLRDTVQEGASYGSICPIQADGSRNVDLIKQRVVTSAAAPIDMRDIDINNITVNFTDKLGNEIASPGSPVLGGSVVISVTIQHEITVPFLGSIIGTNTYPLTVTVADTVLRSKWLSQCSY